MIDAASESMRVDSVCPVHFWPRIQRAANDKTHQGQVTFYLASARRRMAIQAAADAWAHGVPWAEAIKICGGAINRAEAKAKALPKRRPR